MNYDQLKTASYYDTVAPTYDEPEEATDPSRYSPNAIRLKLIRSLLPNLKRGRVFDAGCGTGQLLLPLIEEGFEVAGCDLSAGMVAKAKERISNSGKHAQLFQASLDNLSCLKDHSFDHVFSLGVFPYIPETLEGACYRELRRIMKPGGAFITAHENEVFDTFTFNKYTIRFFERNLFPLLHELSPAVRLDELRMRLSKLITSPEQPVNSDFGRSARDLIFLKPENPITYGEKLAHFGFEHRETLYYNFHSLPPLLRNTDSDLMNLSKQMEIRFTRNWQGLFMASTFINVARAI